MENFGKWWIYGVHQIVVLGMNTEGLNKRDESGGENKKITINKCISGNCRGKLVLHSFNFLLQHSIFII